MPKVADKVVTLEKEFTVQEHAASYLKGVLVFNPDTRKWERAEQPLTEVEFSNVVSAGILEALGQILTELKVHTYYLSQRLNAQDEPESVRNDLSTNP